MHMIERFTLQGLTREVWQEVRQTSRFAPQRVSHGWRIYNSTRTFSQVEIWQGLYEGDRDQIESLQAQALAEARTEWEHEFNRDADGQIDLFEVAE